jgi:multidrug efflux pump subunit AcrB
VPFGSVADVTFGSSYSSISRLNRERTITVSADIDPLIVEPGKLVAEISGEYIPQLL